MRKESKDLVFELKGNLTDFDGETITVLSGKGNNVKEDSESISNIVAELTEVLQSSIGEDIEAKFYVIKKSEGKISE